MRSYKTLKKIKYLTDFNIKITDQSGKVRIWDTVNKEHILKNEFHPFGGPIKDISWSPDNQRMVVVGEGRERYLGSFNFLWIFFKVFIKYILFL